MCLYPRTMINRKYKFTKKNGGNIPTMKDERVQWVTVGCGNCIECRKQKSREWQVRLHEELKASRHAYFVTLSFSPKGLQELCKNYNIKKVNEVATKAVRLYLERWRKKYKKSQRHWYVTELGQTNTERIHLHGIVFLNDGEEKDDITKIWKYGNTWVGKYCTAKTVNYIVKYITKIDIKHKDYQSIILCSPGLGKTFVNEGNAGMYAYRPRATNEFYRLDNGAKVNLPIYYRNKFFDEETREKLWIDKLDKHEIFVRGVKFDVSTIKGMKQYEKFLNQQQRENERLGYGKPTDEWKPKDYDVTLKMLNSNHAQT